jgi:hypothetical protein
VVRSGGACTRLQYMNRRGDTSASLVQAADEVDKYCGVSSTVAKLGPEDEANLPTEKVLVKLAATAARVRLALSVATNAAALAELSGRPLDELDGLNALLSLQISARGLIDMDFFATSWQKFPFHEVHFLSHILIAFSVASQISSCD